MGKKDKIINFINNERYLNIINISLILIPILIYWKYDFTHHTFLRDNIQFTYIYITGMMVFMGLFCALTPNITKIRIKQYFSISSLIMIPGFLVFVENAEIFNIPLYYIFNIHFIQTIIKHDNSPFWLIGLIIISAVLLGLRLFYRTKIKKIKTDITTQQIINYGFLTYLILVPSIWVFTHFNYVSSNFFYMNVYSNIVANIIENPDIAIDKSNIKVFNNFSEMEEYYKEKYKDHTEKLDKLDLNLNEFFEAFKNQFKGYNKKMDYHDVVSFEDWVDFCLNQRHTAYIPSKNMFYKYELFIPKSYDSEPLSHFIMNVKIDYENKNLTSYITFDQSFKKLKKNYFFNFIYIVFHIVFISFWLWIIRIHKRIKK